MGQVTNNLLLEKGLRAEFNRALENGERPEEVMPLIMMTQSTSDQEKYGWLGESPALREWKDERQLSGLNDFDYTLPNVDYESTIKVDKNVMDDDQLGATQIRVRDLARRALIHPRQLFFDALIAGDVDLGYDGVSFFNAAHAESGSNQSNTYTGTGTTTAQFQADFIGARARMRSFLDDQGEPRNEGELDLYVVAPSSLEGVVDEVLSASLLNNTTNTLRGAAKKIISSRLEADDSNDWYLMSGSGVIKPLIQQMRKPMEFVSLETGERAFMRKELLFGVDYRVGFGYGAWYKAVKVTNI